MKELEICDTYGYTIGLGYDSKNGLYIDGVVFPHNGSVEIPIRFPFNKNQYINDFVRKKIRVRIEILED